MADGIGCKCMARSEGECCCCDVDWTPRELVKARATIEKQAEVIRLLDAALVEATPMGAGGKAFELWNQARILLQKGTE